MVTPPTVLGTAPVASLTPFYEPLVPHGRWQEVEAYGYA